MLDLLDHPLRFLSRLAIVAPVASGADTRQFGRLIVWVVVDVSGLQIDRPEPPGPRQAQCPMCDSALLATPPGLLFTGSSDLVPTTWVPLPVPHTVTPCSAVASFCTATVLYALARNPLSRSMLRKGSGA